MLLKTFLYADDSQMLSLAFHFSLEILFRIFSCLLDNSVHNSFLITAINQACSTWDISISVEGNSTLRCAWARNLGLILDYSFSLTHVQSIKSSSYRTFRRCPGPAVSRYIRCHHFGPSCHALSLGVVPLSIALLSTHASCNTILHKAARLFNFFLLI